MGPQNFTSKEHERVVLGPEKMLVVPPRHFCILKNPVVRLAIKEDKNEKREKDPNSPPTNIYRGDVVLDKFGQAKLKHGDKEIRFEQNDPFPLFPGEVLMDKMIPLTVVKPNTQLVLRANRDFLDVDAFPKPEQRNAGDQWLFEGPATYFPSVEVDVVKTTEAIILRPNQALRLKARKACTDKDGIKRKAGQEWLLRREGAYLPGLDEDIVGVVTAKVLTEKIALHLQATQTFVDILGKERKAGEEWLVTSKECETHILDVYEKLLGELALFSLTNREWCIILNPVDAKGVPQLGQTRLVKGETSFFLQPGELLDPMGVQNVHVLGEEEALLVRCLRTFEEQIGNKSKKRIAGQQWIICGPTEYIPPLEVSVLEKRKAALQVESLNLNAFFWQKTWSNPWSVRY